MRITNTTDKNINGGVKVLGFGEVSILPGDTKEIPDNVAYINEVDARGNLTGKKIILPAIRTLARMNQITFVEDHVPATAPAPAPAEVPEKEKAGNDVPEASVEDKKAAAAAKRAATRAANKAAKAAAEGAAAETAE